MLTLAFDTSSKTASVALLDDENIVYEVTINSGRNHSELLLPAIERACASSGTHIRQIDLFACSLGPGSFTGLRIGVGTLKGLMMATGRPAAGLSSLQCLAMNARNCRNVIGTMMDAGRGQVYLAYFRTDARGRLLPLSQEMAAAPQIISECPYEEVTYVGDGAQKYAQLISSAPGKNKIMSADFQFIRAAAAGLLALEKYREHNLLDLQKVLPVYLRSADAVPPRPVFLRGNA